MAHLPETGPVAPNVPPEPLLSAFRRRYGLG